jgi:precorrin-2 dehydrogenase/sirohydrochlorin ferrochelatase
MHTLPLLFSRARSDEEHREKGTMARYFPVCLSVAGRKCLVVGGGEVARRKAASLVAAGAAVTAVSLELCPELSRLERVHLLRRPFEDRDVAGMSLVFAATNDPELNTRVAKVAREHGALVNVVDVPAECDFIVPSTLVRGDLTVSVSTGSAAPALARRLRLELEEQFPQSYADFVAVLGELRALVIREVGDAGRRQAIFRQLADKATWELFTRDGADAVRRLVRRLVPSPSGRG